MAIPIWRSYTAVFCVFLLIVVPTMMPACSNVPPLVAAAGLLLSATSATPGSFITVLHDTIAAGTTIQVEFRGSNGYLVTSETSLTENGAARVAVPPFIDLENSRITSGDVTVSIAGVDSTQTLHINDLLEVEDDLESGELVRLYLQSTIDNYRSAIAKAQTANAALGADGLDMASFVDSVEAQIAALEAVLNEIATTGQLVMELESGETFTLTPEALAVADRLLGSYLIGVTDELQGDGIAKLGPVFQDAVEENRRAGRQAVDDHQRAAMNAASGIKALGGFVSMATGAGLLWVAAGAVSGPGALVGGGVAFLFGGIWLVASSAADSTASLASERLADKYNTGTRDDVNRESEASSELADIAIRAGTVPLKGKFRSLEPVGDIVSGAKDFYQGVSEIRCRNANHQQSTGEDSFCTPQQPDAETTDGGGTDVTGCPTVRYAADINSDGDFRVVTPDVDVTLGFLGQTDRLPICESQSVQIFDAAGTFLDSFSLPFSLVDVPAMETPIVFISISSDGAVFAWIDYLSLEDVTLN